MTLPDPAGIHRGRHGLPDPAGISKGSREYKEKHQDNPPPPPPHKPPPPPPPPTLPDVSPATLAARQKALQSKGGGRVFTGPGGDPEQVYTTGKSLLGM